MNRQPRNILASLLILSLSLLLSVYSIPLLAPTVSASHSGDDWAPLGPLYDNLLVKIYADNQNAEQSDLVARQLDLVDFQVPAASVSTVCNAAGIHCVVSSNLELFGIDYNSFPTTRWFGAIRGTDDNAVTLMRQAIAHITDKDEEISVTLGGLATRLDAPIAGFPDLWGQPFDALHQGPQGTKNAHVNGTLTNQIVVRVRMANSVTPKTSADVFLIHLNADGSLGSYAGLCRDGIECVVVSSATGAPNTTPTPIYSTYTDTANDGVVTFNENTAITFPSTGSYIVYAVNKGTSDFGWGTLAPPNNDVIVNTGTASPSGGWFNPVLYPNAGYEGYCQARDTLVSIVTDIGTGGPVHPFKDANNDCKIDTDSAIYSAPSYQPIDLYIRQDVGRSALGFRLCDRINTLFDSTNAPKQIVGTATAGTWSSSGGGPIGPCTSQPRSQIVPIVFQANPVIDDWNIYTDGYFLSRDFDYVDDLFNAEFAFSDPTGNGCGTVPTGLTIQASDYRGECSRLISSAARATKNTFDPVAAKLATWLIMWHQSMNPVWAGAGFNSYNDAWTGVIDEVGFGPNNYYSWINMYPKKDCSIANRNTVLFNDINNNGCIDNGEAVTMRLGFLSDTQQLNPVWSVWAWDAYILGMVYDSLQGLNPYSLQEDYPAMASGWQNFESPTAGDLGYAPPAGTALTQRWFVKNSLGFSDGTGVTGKDVAFSILAEKETDSPAYGATVGPVSYIRILSDVPLGIVIDVGLTVNAPQFRAGHVVGGLPVMACKVFSTGNAGFPDLPNCGGITTGTTMMAVSNGNVSGINRNPTFDPTHVPDQDGDGVAESSCSDLGSHHTGQLGSGPWILNCTSNGQGTGLGPGGSLVLTPHTVTKASFANSKEYWASQHNYLVWRWADFNNNGVVGTDDKARTRLNPPIGCRNKPVQTNQALWDQNNDGIPDDNCTQFDFNRNGVSSDFSDRARITLEGNVQWTHNSATAGPPTTAGTCRWPWPGPLNCQGQSVAGYHGIAYPWVGWVWWLGHQCVGLDNTKGTADDDKNACWFLKFASRPP